MKSIRLVLLVILICGAIISGCGKLTPEPADTAEQGSGQNPTVDATEKPTDMPVTTLPEPTEVLDTEPEPTSAITPADRQEVEITTFDGTVLNGAYYPPETGPSPIVVLMHQYPLDHETQWFAIAPWLQNRGLQEAVSPGGLPWGDPSWFPVVPDDLEVGVLVFTFRGCQGGCQNANLPGNDKRLWADDARAALLYASTLPEVDPERIVAIGTSIGADGVVDGCLLLEEDELSCSGAMSWSPGDYLGMKYDETVAELTELGVPVRCFAGEADAQSASTCRSFSGENYEMVIDPSGNHGISLVDPNLEIDTLKLLLGFLNETVGE